MSMCKDNYEVCFVQVAGKTLSKHLQQAFEEMHSKLMEPTWITKEECMAITEKQPKLFVMDPFEGEVYNHLNTVQCRIVGPLTILYCLENNDVLPKRPHPVYSVSMRKITVSCSNITNTLREDISMKTARMGGLFSKDLTRSVSHLVVGEVGSKKYQVAANFNLSIMTPDWIESVWNNGQYKLLHASHPSYEKFKCPVFKGLVITVSQLSAEERQSIQSLVEENGGRYLAPLKAHETTHLILSEPIGEKYRYAKNWKVFCVSTKWIFDSIETGYCKDENLYRVENVQPKRSTPNRDLTACELPLVDCSAITNASAVTHLDETVKSELSFTVNRKNSVFSSLELFNMACLPKGGQFLDGCKIFLTGFSQIHLDKLRKIVNAGGGMRFSKYNESVSHVVCGSMDNEFLQNYKQSSIKPYVVSFDWLLECCKEQRMAEEKPFQCMDAAFLSPAKVEATEAKNISMSQKSQPKVENPLQDDNITDIFQQYVCGHNICGDKEVSAKSKYDSSDTAKENDSKLKSNSNTVVSSDAHPSEVINLEEEVTESQQMFVGIKFTLIGFGEKDNDILSEIIRSSSGIVLPSDSAVKIDLAIVPIYWQDPVPYVSNIVTNCWLVKCFEDSRIYDFDENEFFKPVRIASGKKPFESLVLSVSQYAGIERDTLMLLAEKLGATCQEYFVRKANRSKGILPNTHLVLLNPEGSKYEASKKWNIPAVTMKWVIDCAKSGVALSVSKYLVDNLPCTELSDEEIPLCRVEELKSKHSTSLTKPLSHQSSQRKSNTLNPLEVNVVPDNNKKPTLDKYPDKEIDEEIHVNEFNNEGPSMSTPHRTITNLKCESRIGNTVSPIVRTREISLNDTLNLDKSYKYKFQVSSLLNALESSTENSHLEKSLPIGDLFSKNLAVARKVFNLSSRSQSDNSNLDEIYVKDASLKIPSNVLKGVILYVAKKLNNIQKDLNEIVSSLGGSYMLHFDSSCSHFVFSGKMNDLNKEFREARIQNKKIVCPEWVYACKEQQSHVNESLFPHTYKPNMSLSNEIAIMTNVPAENEYQVKKIQVNELVDNLQSDDKKADFNQELNDLLVAAKSAKKRLSKKQVNSITNSPSNQVSPMQKLQKQISTSFTKTIKHEENTDEPDTGSQSQGFPIVWDDPMGRMEREKIAAQAAAVKVNSPQQEISLSNRNSSNLIDENFNKKIEEILTKPNSPVIKKFMFSLIPEPKKEEYVEIIVRLGGEMSDENSFDMSATHLILQKPIKNEKLLSSVASGKWILHPEFLTACEKQGKFVSEEEYEWGGPRTSEFFHNLPQNSRKIAVCPFRWRNKIATHTYTNGAFHGWCVRVLVDDRNKRTTYSKILEAGGASIVSSSETMSDKLTHVIVDVKRKLSQVDLQSYLASGAKCVKPEYLAFYLTEDPPPNVENFLIPEAKILFSDTSEAGSKRQSSCSMTTRLSKRSKHS